jgi:hypothetical protein
MIQKPPVWARVNRGHVSTRGLVSYLPFYERGGLWAHDPVNGIYHRADLVNGPAWSPAGMDGPCLSFDGTDDYVKTTRNDISLLTNTATPHTYIAWINPTRVGATRQSIISVGEFNDVNWSSVLMIDPATGELSWAVDPAAATASSGLFVAASKWQFVAMVRTASDVRFFLGATRVVVANATANGIGPDPILIGGAGRNGALGSFYFAGKIGSSMVYNRALTDVEVSRLYADPYTIFSGREEVAPVVAGGASFNVTLSFVAADAVASTSVANAIGASLSQTSTATYSLAAVDKVGVTLSVPTTNTWSATATVQSGASLNVTTANTVSLQTANAINVNLSKVAADATLTAVVTFGFALPDRAVSFNFICDNAVAVTAVTNLGGQRFPAPPPVFRLGPVIIRYHGGRS